MKNKYGENDAYQSPRAKSKYIFHKCFGAGFSLGIVTTLILFFIYSFIVALLWWSLNRQDPDEPTGKMAVYAIIQGSLGFKCDDYGNYPFIGFI